MDQKIEIMMKTLNKILVFMVAIFLATACYQGIDDITAVDPGPDASAPVVTIKYPINGTTLQVPKLITSINIQFEATDDIELKSVSVMIDEAEIAGFSTFKDYRRVVEEVLFENVTNGDHTLTIKATDLEGKVTNSSVVFTKKPPYEAIFPNEVFYMPFDGDFMEKVTFQDATKVGSPTFSEGALKGVSAYKGATDGYLTFPMTNLKSQEFGVALWCKLNSTPDRAGIISISPTGDSRKNGVRLFREGSAVSQRIKLNVGTGAGETWNDGDVMAPTGEWVHLAFTVSQTECTIYFNGSVARTVPTTAIDWTGCDVMAIGSGMPNFGYWSHKSDLSLFDELRVFNTAITQSEIQNIIQHDSPYVPKYSGEIFYMSFENNYKDLVSNTEATVVGTPGYADGKKGKAYIGATDSYLTFPTAGLQSSSFSAVFWTKINPVPDRAGILVMGPEDLASVDYPVKQNNRKNGFRFFRENAAGKQRFKLNTGNGTADTWVDGGVAASVDPTTGNWEHMAFTITQTEAIVYINGEIVKQSTITGLDWTGCDLLSIMSGAPRFTGWSHLSDLGMMDELRLFNKALTQTEIKAIINAEK